MASMLSCKLAAAHRVARPHWGCSPAVRSCPSSLPRLSRAAPQIARASPETDADTEGLSGEWPVNWSLASYEDVGEFFSHNLFKDAAPPGKVLGDMMSTDLTTTTPDTKVDQLGPIFNKVTGVPVVKSETDRTLVGILSKKDLSKSGSTVGDIMSTPPVAARPTSTVADAAVLMLKHKVHRIPIVDPEAKLIGIVTRTDIFTALGKDASPDVKSAMTP